MCSRKQHTERQRNGHGHGSGLNRRFVQKKANLMILLRAERNLSANIDIVIYWKSAILISSPSLDFGQSFNAPRNRFLFAYTKSVENSLTLKERQER